MGYHVWIRRHPDYLLEEDAVKLATVLQIYLAEALYIKDIRECTVNDFEIQDYKMHEPEKLLLMDNVSICVYFKNEEENELDLKEAKKYIVSKIKALNFFKKFSFDENKDYVGLIGVISLGE